VITTTLRLWWQRHVAVLFRQRRYRRAAVVALVVALAGASATAISLAVTQSSPGDPPADPGNSATTTLSTSQLAAAQENRQQAATWVAAQIGRNVIVSCDPLMCTALAQGGFPAANLASLGPNAADPLGSGVVVATPAVRSQFGIRLATVYAPVVIASFGAGASQVQIRVVAPDGSAAYMATEKTDLQARVAAGRELLGNTNVLLPAVARRQLLAGQVDVRLLITLAGLAHRYRVEVRGFGDAGPGATTGVPLRSMTLAMTSSSYLAQMQAFLRAQRAPLLAQTSVGGTGRDVVLTIEFTAPSPLGLLSQN
jgi:hypothetical protein